VLAGEDIEGVLSGVSERARVLVGAAAAWVLVPDRTDPDVLRVAAAAGRVADGIVGATVDATTSLSARAMQAGQPVEIGDMSAEPAVLREARHAGFGPGVYLPMVTQNGPIGALVVARDAGADGFVQEEVDAVEVFARAAAVGIALGGARDALEDLHIVSEHERIARDLHDTVIQRLFATGLGLQGLSRVVGDVTVADRIQAAVDDLDATIREIRGVIFELQANERGPSGCRVRVLALAAEMTPALGFEPRVRFDGPVDSIVGADLGEHLLAALRELLSNVVRHAQATGVEVRVRAGIEVTLTVEDNGVGLSNDRSAGLGLANLSDRARSLGGSFTLEAGASRGVRAVWSVPREPHRRR
jgi:signal transduction histidine kinase